MVQEIGVIRRNDRMTDTIYLLEVQTPEISKEASPGSFVLISLGTTFDPFLRRPMSICNVIGDSLQIVYQVVGRGTELMTKFKVGHSLDIMGPLGNGFTIEEEGYNILLGGGVGVAPLVYLSSILSQRQKPQKFLLGMRSNELDFIRDMVSVDLDITRESSPSPQPRLVTELLKPLLETKGRVNLYCCGPEIMYKTIQKICQDRENLKGQISLDKHMACGVGACLGCIVPIKKPGRKESINMRACADGPVFKLEEVVFND